MSEQVHFIVEGEWLTNHICNRFWNEYESYENIENFICRILGCDKNDPDTKEFIRDLLEHKVKLVGQNTLEVVDCDPSEYRPITEHISQLDKQRALNAIEADIERFPLKYIDTLTTIMSLKGAPINSDFNTYDDIVDYFGYGNTRFTPRKNDPLPDYEKPTKAGLWLLEGGAKLVYKIAGEKGRFAPNFWEKVDNYTAGKPGFEERNQRVAAIRRNDCIPNDKSSNNKAFYEPLLTTPDGFKNRTVEPDNHTSKCGMVSPDGKWFSCGWAEHEELSRRIVEQYWQNLDFSNAAQYRKPIDEKYYEHETEIKTSRDARAWSLTHDTLTFLVQDAHWVVFRYDNSIGWQLICPNTWSTTHDHPTKAQTNCVWDQLVIHNISDTVRNIEYFI